MSRLAPPPGGFPTEPPSNLPGGLPSLPPARCAVGPLGGLPSGASSHLTSWPPLPTEAGAPYRAPARSGDHTTATGDGTLPVGRPRARRSTVRPHAVGRGAGATGSGTRGVGGTGLR